MSPTCISSSLRKKGKDFPENNRNVILQIKETVPLKMNILLPYPSVIIHKRRYCEKCYGNFLSFSPYNGDQNCLVTNILKNIFNVHKRTTIGVNKLQNLHFWMKNAFINTNSRNIKRGMPQSLFNVIVWQKKKKKAK